MDVRKRKRGIRASRSKLETAMIKAGFETQAELAHAIAKNEGIEKPPKDLVSKVFREQAVSTHNLARIAYSLGVDAHTIYLSKEEDEFGEIVGTQQHNLARPVSAATDDTAITESHLKENKQAASSASSGPSGESNDSATKKTKNAQMQIIVAGLFLLLIVSVFMYWHNKDTNVIKSAKQQGLESALGKIKIIIQAPEELKPLAQKFASQLSQLESVSSTVANTPGSYYLSSYEALDKWQAQAVLKLGLVKGPYYQSISAKISAEKREANALQAVVSSAELLRQSDTMSQRLVSNIQAFINGGATATNNALYSPALAPYLRAKNLAFGAHSAADFQTALDFFQQAINIEADFTSAHAGICQTQVRMSWIQDESSLLEQAAQSCRRAKNLNSQNIDFKMAQAEFFSRAGQLDKAIALLKPEVDSKAITADTLAMLAELYLTKFSQSNQPEAIAYAKEYAQKAVDLNSQHWRAYNTLGNLYFSTGDTSSAKNQFFAASKIVKHEVILANLGTLQMCFGELDQAKQTYSDVIANFTSNYIGYESLGSVYFFEHNYEQALKNKLIAIEKQPDISIHQVWAGLAEAYLFNQQTEHAWENYAKALTLIERDELLENISFSDELHKIYYQQKLATIKPQQASVVDLSSKIDALIEQRSKLGLKARSHLAWLAGVANRPQEKAIIWDEIKQACSVYKHTPELLAQAL